MSQAELDKIKRESPSAKRAWIEMATNSYREGRLRSPSAKRAWIEMRPNFTAYIIKIRSPSAKRAWIEIETGAGACTLLAEVALCEEGVDRNGSLDHLQIVRIGRPLRRGRG